MSLRLAVAGGDEGKGLVRCESVEGVCSHLRNREKAALRGMGMYVRWCMVCPETEQIDQSGPDDHEHGIEIEVASMPGLEEQVLLEMGRRIMERRLGCGVV